MTILITGATGLVGERLVPRLIDAGLDCRALIRPGKSAPAAVQAVEGDILAPYALEEAVTGVTAVIHLAAVFRTTDEHLIWKNNVDGTRNLLNAVEAHAPDARFLLASTGHVYAKDQARPGLETDAVNPTHLYPASKVAAENMVRASGLNWSVLRFPFIYGDGDGHLEMLPKHIGGWHPAQRMSVVHHRDIAGAIGCAIRGAMDRKVVNISDDVAPSVYELVQLTGGAIAPSSAPLADPWHLQMNNALARTLGFQPTVRTIAQALEESLL
nr:NAD(P)-dependent oxidoreductase [uncultured Sphingomonas sp.]